MHRKHLNTREYAHIHKYTHTHTHTHTHIHFVNYVFFFEKEETRLIKSVISKTNSLKKELDLFE